MSNANHLSCFEQIAQIVRARDIQYEIGDIVLDGSLYDNRLGREDYMFSVDLPVIVVGAAEAPIGWYDPEEVDRAFWGASSPAVADVMQRLSRADVINADATFLECVELIAIEPDRFLVVMDQGKPVGHIRFRNLFDPVGRLCLLRLVFDAEVAAINLFWVQDAVRFQRIVEEEKIDGNSFKQLKRSLKSSPHRISHLKRLPEDFREEELAKQWMAGISFKRKEEILTKHGLMLPAIDDAKLAAIFKRARFLRNSCAHPSGFEHERYLWSPEPEIAPQSFGELYHDLRWLTNELNEQARREVRVQKGLPENSAG